MHLWLLAIWFGIFVTGAVTYLVLQRTAAQTTSTPLGLLWVVIMMPALIWATWITIVGPGKQSLFMLLLVLLTAYPLYWVLLYRGRFSQNTTPPTSSSDRAESSQLPMTQSTSPEGKIPRLLNQSEEAELQGCFPWSIYYLQNIEYRPQAVICRGQLRASSASAYQTVRENVGRYFGNRFLFVFQEGLNRKPFFALVPNPQAQSEEQSTAPTLQGQAWAIVLLLLTIVSMAFSGAFTATNPAVNKIDDAEALLEQVVKLGVPFAIAMTIIIACFEFGRYFTARSYHLRVSLPQFLPIPFPLSPAGTLGALTRLRSPIPDRQALFDIAFIGPIIGLIGTVPLLIWGLAHSEVVPTPEKLKALSFYAIDPSSSLLLFLLSKLALGSSLVAGKSLDLHPVAIAGYFGLFLAALKLLPIGQLEGGQIVHAMFGQQGGAIIGVISRILLLLLALVVYGNSAIVLFAILLFLIPATAEPALNNVTELDNRRDILGLIALALLLLIILPAPKALISAWL